MAQPAQFMAKTLFKDADGLVYHGGASLYALTMWSAGLAGLFHPHWAVNLLAMLALAHGMIIAAYMIHECCHNMVFHRSRNNARLGNVLSWVCGASYGTYEDMRYKHFRHHVDNDDVVWFDYDRFFEEHSRLTRTLKALEWMYIPAHDLLMHGIMVFTSFVIPKRRDQRLRNLLVILIRGGLFVAVLLIAPKAALLYVVAYLLMVHVLRFVDMLQHDYPYNLTLFEYQPPPHKGDAVWEQEHTFSNPISLKLPLLNWLVLNFGYHNAHHADMTVPWFRLPALHERITGGDESRVIPFLSQLRLYHANRVRRVHNPQPEGYPKGDEYLAAARTGRGPVGGNAASFLTSF